MKIDKLPVVLGFFVAFSAVSAYGQAQIGINGTVDWGRMEINAVVSLDLASAGLKLPAGRTQGEALIASEYLRLIRPGILHLQVDSSSVIGDLVGRGEWTLQEVERLALRAHSVPPALSQDFGSLSASYSLGMDGIVAAHIRHEHSAEVPRTLRSVSAPAYTGIIIIASGSMPVHGMQGAALVRPCLFPKIWDTDMNLIYERNMLNPRVGAMARYFSSGGIFAGGPSGLSREIAAVVGDRPLRIFAQGVFGVKPTDPVINREDAMQIIASADNRNLLRDGRVVIILDDSMLKSPIGD